MTADHGQGFEAGLEPVSQSLEKEYVNVPFVVRYPGVLSPARVPGDVSTIDLFPTILGLIGAPPCPAWHGVDALAPAMPGTPPRPVLVGSIVWESRWRVLCGDVELEADLLRRLWDLRPRDGARSGRRLPPGDPRAGALLRWLLLTIGSQQAFYEDADVRRTSLPPELPELPRW